jgi:hypothetical protein
MASAPNAVGHTVVVESLRTDLRTRRFALVVLLAAAVYSWVAAGFRPFTTAEEVMVAIPAIVVFVFAWRPSRPSSPRAADGWARTSVVLWLGLVVVAVGWELMAFFSSPRADHPTLSVIADDIMSVHAGRASMFLLWLTLGWLFVKSPRTDRH